VLRIVDAEVPPLRVLFGTTPLEVIENEYAGRLEMWRARRVTQLRALSATRGRP
jgi:hypothetical protein